MIKKINLTILILLIIIGFWLRIRQLGDLPLQSDEAVNWFLATSSLDQGQVKYDPQNFHGPLFFRLLKLFSLESEVQLRLLSVIAGILLIFTPFYLLRFISVEKTLLASVLISLDPILIYYSRVCIHEMLFAFLSTLLIVLFFKLHREKAAYQSILSGIILGLLIGTKETWIIPLGSSFFALWAISKDISLKSLIGKTSAIFCIALLTSTLIFFNSTNFWQVFVGLYSWGKHGFSDRPQFQPFWYLLLLIGIVSPLALLGLYNWKEKKEANRYFLISAVLQLLIYSIIPYKTPWLSVGIIVVLYLSLATTNIAQKYLLSLLILQLGLQFLPFKAQFLGVNNTRPEVRVLAEKVLTQCLKAGEHCKVVVSAKWYWPLPFYLRKIQKKILYTEDTPALPLDSFDVIILPSAATKELKGWTREEFPISRVQQVAMYYRQ